MASLACAVSRSVLGRGLSVHNTARVKENGSPGLFVDADDFHLHRHWNGYLCHSFETWWALLGSDHGLHLSYRRRPLHDGKFDLTGFCYWKSYNFAFDGDWTLFLHLWLFFILLCSNYTAPSPALPPVWQQLAPSFLTPGPMCKTRERQGDLYCTHT